MVLTDELTALFLWNARKEFEKDQDKTTEKFMTLYQLIRRAYYAGPPCGHAQAKEYLIEFNDRGCIDGDKVIFKKNPQLADNYKQYC